MPQRLSERAELLSLRLTIALACLASLRTLLLATVELSMSADDRFTWKHAHPDRSQTFEGKYEVAGKTIVLSYSNGGTMVATIDAKGKDQFSFKMLGGATDDPGLSFIK